VLSASKLDVDGRPGLAVIVRTADWIICGPPSQSGRRYCPLCDAWFRRFGPLRTRTDARCPTCHARERDRLIYMYLLRKTEALLPDSACMVLEAGPSRPLASRLSSELGSRYVSFDRYEITIDPS